MIKQLCLTTITVLFGAIFIPIVWWLIGAFIVAEINPFEWEEGGRGTLVTISLCTFWIPGVVVWNLSED